MSNCSHDDLDLQFRYLGKETEILKQKTEMRGITPTELERLSTDSFMRGVLAMFCYYRDGRPALAKLLERQAVEISETDIERYQERRLISPEQALKIKEDIGICVKK